MKQQRIPKVLFLCTGNSARSQMAEAFVRHYAGDRLEPYSAGLDPKPIQPYTMQVMEELGLDMSGHRSKSLREYLGHLHFEYMVTVCDYADRDCPTTFVGYGKRLHWSFEDPAAFVGTPEETLAKFRDVRDQIGQRVQLWLGEGMPG